MPSHSDPEPEPAAAPPRSLRRELRAIGVLYLAIAVIPILLGNCAG